MQCDVQREILTPDDVRELARTVLIAAGTDDHGSNVIANLVMISERDGLRSHGLAMLPHYIQSFTPGYANPKAVPKVKRVAPAVIRGDGDNDYFQIAFEKARPLLIEAARENGIAGFTCANTHHLAALRFDTGSLADEGLIAIGMVNCLALVVPHGGDKPIFGTNPMSFAWPREGADPIVWDQSSSIVALMEIKLAAAEGRDLSARGGLDREGNVTANAAKIAQTRSLLPFAEHKGNGIALMVELLSAALAGGALSTATEDKDSFGALNIKPGVTFIAIDPSKWGNVVFAGHVAAVAQQIDVMKGARVPGDGRLRKRTRAEKEGISVSRELMQELQGLKAG